MEKKKITRLINDLSKYHKEITASEDESLNSALEIVIDSLKHRLDELPRANSNDINVIIELIEERDFSKMENDYPRINYNILKDVVDSKIDFKSLDSYTILELKVIYFLLTKDRENNAMKTRKKEAVINAVKEVVFNHERATRLKDEI